MLILKIKNHLKSHLSEITTMNASINITALRFLGIYVDRWLMHSQVWSSVIMHDLYIFVLNLQLNTFQSLRNKFDDEKGKPNEVYMVFYS